MISVPKRKSKGNGRSSPPPHKGHSPAVLFSSGPIPQQYQDTLLQGAQRPYFRDVRLISQRRRGNYSYREYDYRGVVSDSKRERKGSERLVPALNKGCTVVVSVFCAAWSPVHRPVRSTRGIQWTRVVTHPANIPSTQFLVDHRHSRTGG